MSIALKSAHVRLVADSAVALVTAFAAGIAQAQDAGQLNVICSVQAEWCNLIQTVFAKTTGIKVNISLNLETAVGRARVGHHGVRWQGVTTTRARRPLGGATRPACARAAQSGA